MIDGNQVYFQGILNFGTLDARGLLARQQRGASERVALVGERPLGADPITLPFISPESRFDPGNLIGRLEKRFLKGLLLVKCTMILGKPVLQSFPPNRSINREVKHDVYGKRQTAKRKLLPSLFSSLYSRIKIFVFAVNSKKHSYFCVIY